MIYHHAPKVHSSRCLHGACPGGNLTDLDLPACLAACVPLPGDDQEQFKTQIYTALCLALSIGVFFLTIYVILPEQHVEVPDEIDPLKQIKALDGKG